MNECGTYWPGGINAVFITLKATKMLPQCCNLAFKIFGLKVYTRGHEDCLPILIQCTLLIYIKLIWHCLLYKGTKRSPINSINCALVLFLIILFGFYFSLPEWNVIWYKNIQNVFINKRLYAVGVHVTSASPYLFSIPAVFGHHLSQRLQNFDAQPLFILLQQLLGMFDEPVEMWRH